MIKVAVMKLLFNIVILLTNLVINQGQSPQIEPARAEKQDRVEGKLKIGKEAIDEARQRVAAHPDSAEAHFILAETLSYGPATAEELAKLGEEYLKAIELKPDYAEAYLKLGSWYANRDHYEKGYEALNKAISLRPDYAEAYCALGFAYIQKKFGDGHRLPQTEEESTKAVNAFGKAIQLKPDFVVAHVGLGIAKSYLGQLNEALQAFKQAASLNPNDVMSHMGIGDYYIKLGDKSAAMKEYEALMRIASEEKAARKEHGLESYSSLAESYAQVLLKQIKERFEK